MNWHLVETHLFLVRRVICLRSPRDPEEAESAGTQALIRSAEAYDPSKGDFENLAYIAISRAITDLQRQDKRGIHDPGEGRSVDPGQHTAAVHNETVSGVQSALLWLSPAKRRLIALKYGIATKEHTMQELAVLFQRNETNLLDWIWSAESTLRKRLNCPD